MTQNQTPSGFHALLLALGVLLLLAPVASTSAQEEPLFETFEHSGPFPAPSGHGFFMFGAEHLMLYHSSVFDATDHSYQMILKANLQPASVRDFYQQNYENPDYECSTVSGYTWIVHNDSPHQHFTLPHLFSGEVASFTGDLKFINTATGQYRHDCPQRESGANATVNVERMMYFRRYDLSADYPDQLTYLLFGMGDDAYMAHYLTKRNSSGSASAPPDPLAFDDIVRIDRPGWLPPSQEDVFSTVLEVKIPSVSVPTLPTASPLGVQTDHNVTVHGIPSDGGPLTVHVRKSYRLDTRIINLTN
jgi:hypothetical protein